jgi:aminodeoxyfutalosine deaminase
MSEMTAPTLQHFPTKSNELRLQDSDIGNSSQPDGPACSKITGSDSLAVSCPRAILAEPKTDARPLIYRLSPASQGHPAACQLGTSQSEWSTAMNLHEFARSIPKVELHVHLEGAIRPATLLQLADRNGATLPATDVDGLRQFYRFRDFAHFLDVYVTITDCLRTPEDYQLIAHEFGSDCARQNIRYAEVTFTIATNMTLTGLPWHIILEGLNAGRIQARKDFGVDWRWVFDISRNHPETQDEVLDIAIEARDQGVTALGLGGPEVDFPPELFIDAFSRARDLGLPRVPHAGEMLGPESVWMALHKLHADRLGHGVRSVEDPGLVDYLIEHQVPVELCPTSNIRLGVFPDYTSHPLRQLWDSGVYVTVNSDDPPLFGADLNHEYEVLVDDFGFDAADLEQISLNALRASLLPTGEKARIEKDFVTEFSQLRAELGRMHRTFDPGKQSTSSRLC